MLGGNMKNKGFTLIELLAVIVILAIIALIATPIILGIITNAKNEVRLRSAELYGHAVEQAVLRYQLNQSYTQFDPEVCIVQSDSTKLECDGVLITISVDGLKPDANSELYLSKGQIVSVENYVLDGQAIEYVNGGYRIKTSATTYSIVLGGGQSCPTNMPLIFKADADHNKLDSVKVDGEVVNSSNYIVTQGSTLITFDTDYSSTLTQGSHSIELVFSDGVAQSTFSMVPQVNNSYAVKIFWEEEVNGELEKTYD